MASHVTPLWQHNEIALLVPDESTYIYKRYYIISSSSIVCSLVPTAFPHTHMYIVEFYYQSKILQLALLTRDITAERASSYRRNEEAYPQHNIKQCIPQFAYIHHPESTKSRCTLVTVLYIGGCGNTMAFISMLTKH